ncbi:MAG: RNA-directed DNA polymerase, partial [Pseudoalteromonas sp.]|nr:RNA-directed DNA polymerase [Pseudoalteromonas sp.]
RIASDFRQLNLRTVINAGPLPRIDDIFDAIGDVKPKFFTALDMASGYHQIKMSRKAQKMSAIVCGPYHLEWLRMPFGLSQSPQFFMSYMTRTLQGIDDKRIFVFLDDIIIVSEDIETHLDLIRKVFARLRDRGLRLKPSKCEFLCTEITFLGLVLNKDGLRTDPKKVAAITEYEEPTDLKGVRSFLGMAGYLRKFIPNF